MLRIELNSFCCTDYTCQHVGMQQGRSKLMSLIIEIAVMPQSDWCFEMGVWKKQFFTAMLRKGTCQ